MPRKVLVSLLLLVLFPALIFAGTTGKLRGKVTDRESGEPLVGATVAVVGTTLGASTDINGEYIILNVPVGLLSVKGSYVGYTPFTVSNVRVSADLTTEVNLLLQSEGVQVPTVEIVSERPLIQKNATNAISFATAQDIQNLPTRGFANLVSLSPGVVNLGGTIYVRGGRQDEVGYFVEGIQVRDPLFGGNDLGIINDAIEEIQVQSGGYTAEYGGANSGIVITSLKTGGEKYRFSAEAITDSWANNGVRKAGAYSYGYSEYVATLSGPVPGADRLRFYLAGNNIFNRTAIRYWDGVNLQGLVDPTLTTGEVTNMVAPAGMLPNNAYQQWTFNGNVFADFKPIKIKVSGTYSSTTQHGDPVNVDPLRNLFDEARLPLTEGHDISASVRLTHVLSPSTFYELIGNYFDTFSEAMDPFLRSRWDLYGDSLANAQYGFTLKAMGENPDQLVLFGTAFNRYGSEISFYDKIRQSSIGFKGDIVHQVGTLHEFKAGGEFTRYTLRRFNLAAAMARNYAVEKRDNPDSSQFALLRSVRLDNYGYGFDGLQTDDLPEGYQAHHPVFAAGFLQDKIEYQDLVINAGLRLDYISIDQKMPRDVHNIAFTANGLINQDSLVDVGAKTYVSPRLGLAFPVTDRTVFHTQWGNFVQQSRLRDLYLGTIAASTNIKGGNAIQEDLGFGLRPERTTQYELGFNQMLSDNSSFDATVYYRDIKDQIQVRYISRAAGAAHQTYFAFVNGDFATTKGFELKFTLRRTERIAAQAYYSFADARGTGSNSASAFRTVWQSPVADIFFPQYVTPLAFNEAHRGSLNLDYRFGQDDGPTVAGSKILQRTGLSLLFTFNSGHNYTRISSNYGNARIPTEELNASTTPWNFQLDLKLDKYFRVGPVDLDVYLWAINVLDTKNVVNVYPQTGTADDDGYLQTAEGKKNIEIYGQQYASLYNTFLADGYNFENGVAGYRNPWGAPRQYRFGLRVEY
jgi:outer membrane receptor protein involved in Fe transport